MKRKVLTADDVRKKLKPLNLKCKPVNPNEIVEIYDDCMRIRRIPPIRMTKREYTKMRNRQMGQQLRRLREWLQEKERLEKLSPGNNITFGFACP